MAGDEQRCRRIVFDLYFAGHAAHEICDRVLARAFHAIGDRWECGAAEVYQERRACDLCLRVLGELRAAVPEAKAGAVVALGGAPECDPYTLPTAMAEVVLRHAGWNARSLGRDCRWRRCARRFATRSRKSFG